MRDPNQHNSSSRSSLTYRKMRRMARRSILASALLAAAAPAAMADEGGSSVRLLPPLPVQQVANQEVYANPFCEPKFRPIQDKNVLLASGDSDSPPVRLKAMGKAVDLKPIGKGMPTAVRPRGLKIENTAAPSVRMNPLIESEHRANKDLINAGVTPMTNERLEELELTRRGQTLAPAVRVAPQSASSLPAPPEPPALSSLPSPMASTPRTAASSQTTPAKNLSAVLSEQLDKMAAQLSPPVKVAEVDQVLPAPEPSLVDTKDTKELAGQPAEPVVAKAEVEKASPTQPEPAQVVQDAAKEEVSQPVFFTISDKLEDSQTEDIEAASPSGSVAKEMVSPEPVAGLAEPIGLQPISKDNLAAGPKSDSLRRITKPAGQGIVRSAPLPKQPGLGGAAELRNKRFRPPVAVGAPPVAITNSQKPNATVKPALQNPIIASMARSGAKPVRRNAPIKLHLTRAQVKSLTIGGHVRRISVNDNKVCQAIASGPNQLKLIGTGYGVTRLVVWADTAHKSPTRIKTFEIHVEEAVDATGSSVGNKAVTLNGTIERAFPNAVITVERFPDRLIVAGLCDSEDEAKKIIRMVRKTCIIPVRDEIKVR